MKLDLLLQVELFSFGVGCRPGHQAKWKMESVE